jgi:L-alanine-DL-glutamate epimerase-like enolase superfamily enzyme
MARPVVDRLDVSAYTVPTDQPESDGTLAWDKTTLVLVEVAVGDTTGVGWSYTGVAACDVVSDHLAGEVVGHDAMSVGAAWQRMGHAVRNLGAPGLVMTAISAVDVALWDLKARLLGRPLTDVLDRVHDEVAIYGSGGFTSYDDETLADQLAGWAAQGIPRVKLKVGRDPGRDDHRLQVARKAVGDDTELFVDANGAWSRKQAVRIAQRWVGEYDVRWFEEPVSSDDLGGLALVRDHVPVDVAAGEYGYTLGYFARMLPAVDCLQADVTRCGGFTGFRAVGALCEAAQVDLSAHCAPQLSAFALASVARARHVEWFHDHVRIERLLFDGVLQPAPGGLLSLTAAGTAGLGVALRGADAEKFRVR